MARAGLILATIFILLGLAIPASEAAGVSNSNLESLWAKCAENLETARSACTDSKSSAGMSSTSAAQMASQVATVTQLAASASSSKAAAQACAISAGISAAIQVISVLKGDSCSNSRGKCLNACAEFSSSAKSHAASLQASADPSAASEIAKINSQISKANSNSGTCNQYKAQIANAAVQYLSIAQNLAQAYSCISSLTSTSATPTPVELTETTYDCSNASYAATNMVCICQTTPGDPMCAGLSTSSSLGSAGTVGTSLATPSFSSSEATDGAIVDTTPVGSTGTSGSNVSAGSGGGGGVSGGGSSSLPGSGDGIAGPGEFGVDKNVITGTTSGGGGVAALTSQGGGVAAKAASGLNFSAGGPKDFDPKKYLPKNIYQNRGLAGMSIPATDGVTGPLGPSLWEKVSNRYQVVKPSMLHDK